MQLFNFPSVLFLLAVSSPSFASHHSLNIPGFSGSFKPRLYPKSVAHCSAINRSNDNAIDINLHYVDVNPDPGRTVVLVHGWPGLWSNWANQIQYFQKDYRLLIPDLRGFGESTHPGDVQTSGTMADMVTDLACVMQHAGVADKAVCVGHDWGAQICWEAARMRPDLFGAVAGAVVPYISADGPFMPVEELAVLLPRLTYQVYFEKQLHTAGEELNSDIRRTLRAVMRSVASPPPAEFLTSSTSFLAAWGDHKEIPVIPFLTREEEDYLVEQYSTQGFGNTLQFYTHGERTWCLDRAQGNFSISQPALYIMPTNDPVADWALASAALRSPSFFSQLSIHTIATAHWPQLENPEEFNQILEDWLETISPVL